MSQPRHVGVSFGKLATFHDGLGEFSRQLGQRLAAAAPALREEGIELHFHLRPALHGHFGHEVNYLAATDLQRWWHWGERPFDLWHSLNQFNAYRVPRRARQVVQTIHDLNFLYLREPRKQPKYLRRMQSLLDRADEVLTISRHVADDIAHHLRPRHPVRVIHNGADDFQQVTPEPLALPDGFDGYFLHISRLAPSKNVECLLDAAQAWPESRWVLAGADSPYARHVAEQVRARGLANVALFFDISVGQKAWAYAHAGAFVFPSLAEGFGLPPIEAMQFGTPTVLARRTSLPEIGGDAAAYLDSFEPDTIRHTLTACLAQDCTESRARTQARARTFTWDRCAEAHLALYRSCLGR